MNIIKSDVVQIFLLFMLSIISRYFLPVSVGNAYFMFLLVIFYRSERNYFWLAFFLIILDPPGNLFYKLSDNYSLPQYSLTSAVSLTYGHIVFFTASMKSLKYGANDAFFKSGITLLGIYLIFLSIYTVIHDDNIIRLIGIMLIVMPYLSLFFIPRLMPTVEDYVNFFRILFPFVLLLFLAQIFDLIALRPFASYLGESQAFSYSGIIVSGDEDLSQNIEKLGRASIYGVHILLISLIAALSFLSMGIKYFRPYYLVTLVTLIWLSFVMTGTRGWIIGISFMLVLTGLLNIKNLTSIVRSAVIPLVVLAIIFFFTNNIISKVTLLGLDRFKSLNLLVQGDITAGDTLDRLSLKGPIVFNKYLESPIIGYGFTDEYMTYADGHVGHHTMLLNGGVIGYALFMFLFIQFSYKLIVAYRVTSRTNMYRKCVIVLLAGFGGMFIIHSSTAMIFSYHVGFPKGLMLGLFFMFTDIVYRTLWEQELIPVSSN